MFPIGGEPNVTDFFAAYLSVPVILVFYIDHMIWRNDLKFIRARDIDLDAGRRDLDFYLLKQELEERKFLATMPIWYRPYSILC